MFKDIHIISKLFVFFFCSLAIILLPFSPVWLLLLFFSLILFQNLVLFFVEIVLFFLSFMVAPVFLLLKLLFLGLFIILFSKGVTFREVLDAIEILFYPIPSTKLLYMVVSWSYFIKNIQLMNTRHLKIYSMLGRHLRFQDYFSLIKRSVGDAKKETSKILLTLEYRLYHCKRKRTNLESTRVSTLDTKYIVVSMLLFFIVYMWR